MSFIALTLTDGRRFHMRSEAIVAVYPQLTPPTREKSYIPEDYVEPLAYVAVLGAEEDLGVLETDEQVLGIIAQAERTR